MGLEPQRDEDLLRMIDSLDEEMQQELLALCDGHSVDPVEDTTQTPALNRIKQNVSAKLGLRFELERVPSPATNSAQAARKKRIAYGVGAAVVVLGLLAASPGPVSAALQKMIQFIPGIGPIQQQNQPSTATGVAVLQKPVHTTWLGSPVTIVGVMVSPTQILVQLNGEGYSAPRDVSFQTAGGKTFDLRSYQAVSAGGTGSHPSQWSGNYGSTGSFGQVGSVLSGTLIIGADTQSPAHIPVQLHLAKDVIDLSQLGPTDSHQGISIATVATRDGKKINLTLAYQYQGPYHIWDFAPGIASPALPEAYQQGIEVTDSKGTVYDVKKQMTVGPGNQFTFQPKTGQTEFHVTIPQVDAGYDGSSTYVTLPIPAKGSEPFNKTVNLAGFPITFTKVERVTDNGSHSALRMYFNLHASLTQPKELYSFQIREHNMGISNSGRLDPKTGAVEWLEFSVKPGQKSVRLQLTDPEVYIRGPWTFDVHVPVNQAVGQAEGVNAPQGSNLNGTRTTNSVGKMDSSAGSTGSSGANGSK